MKGNPHIARRHGNHYESAVRAHCDDHAHIAQMRDNSLKNHDRPKPHLAALYPAIVRLWFPSFPAFPPDLRWSTP